ncbi:TPA: lantibiotic dehydratase C-terminal domain-containing protein, partial [Streptococcus suis]
IYKIFSLNADTEQLNNCYSLNYLSNDQTINFLLRNKYSNRINVNFYSSQTLGIELSDIYVTIDLSRNRFVVLDSSNQILNISTNSTLNINLLEEECQFLLMLSDINNIPFNYLPDFSHIFDYLPRVTVDNKLIIYREQFIIKYNSLLFNTVESLKSVILDYISNSVAKSFCYVREDVEVFINCLDNSNFKYLFKEIKKHKILHFKEAIQEKSFLFIDNKQYANEIVISLKRGEEQYEDYSDIPLLDKAQEIDILDDWVFFEIVLDNFIESILESMLELVEMNIKFFYIFYVNDIGEKVLRLRCKNVDNFPEILRILKKNNLRDFIIKPYIKESGRYFNMGIGNFEKFSCKDSIRILKTLSKNIDFDTLDESRIYELILKNTEYLFEYFKLSLIERYGILKDFIVGKEDRRKSDKVTRIMESDLGFINRFPIIENYGDSDHMSLIHMSNIRLVGNIPTLE